MKKSIALRTALFLIAVPLFFSCNDEAPYYGEGIYSDFNGYYSNKTLKDPAAGVLELSYSDVELSGKEVWFELMTKNTARLKFANVLPFEKETVIDVKLVATPNGFTISPDDFTTPKNTSFNYKGSIATDESGQQILSLELTGVTMPTNLLSGLGTLKVANNIHFEWTYTDEDAQGQTQTRNVLDDLIPGSGTALSDIAVKLIGNAIYLSLDELYFHTDGNITSRYSRFEEGATLRDRIRDILSYDNPGPEDRGPSELSPRNLVFYYCPSDNVFYASPEVTGIYNLVSYNRSQSTRADESGGINIIEILNLISRIDGAWNTLQGWLTDGLKMNIEQGGQSDYLVYVDRAEVRTILNLLSSLWNLLDIDLPSVDIGEFVPGSGGSYILDLNQLMDELFYRIPKTEDLKFGIYLQTL